MTSKSLRWIVAGILILCLCSGIATASTRTRILQGATIFIGEQGLDISTAMGSYNYIAWWSSGSSPGTSSPSTIIDVSGSKTSFYVAPATYASRQGTWYLWDGSNPPSPTPAFSISDPSLSSSIWDLTRLVDTTGKSAPRGDYLTFRVTTDMYDVLQDIHRENRAGDTDGFLTYKVVTPEGATLTSLYNSALTLQPLTAQTVHFYPDYWGKWEAVPYYWATGAAYPAGTYSVRVESNLNGMKDNYKDPGGADYTGKTVSAPRTVTLVGNTGNIAVQTTPDGASVIIDNVLTGVTTTPTLTVITGIAPGSRVVRVSLDGYQDQQTTVGVDAGGTSSVVFTMVPGGDPVTITYAGDGSFYFGEELRFSGTNTESDTTYLFIRGPGLPSEGAQMEAADPKSNPVVNGNGATFARATVEADNTWEYRWSTSEEIPIDEGTYEVYASAYPADYNNLATAFSRADIELQWPFITASMNPFVGTFGSTFTISGSKTGGTSPDYYIYLTITNNTPPALTGSLPAEGVRLDNFATVSQTGVDATLVRVPVQVDTSWSYAWNTGTIAGGVPLPGSKYRIYIMNRPYSIPDMEALPYPPAPGNYNRAGYTRLQVAFEGPVTADFSYDNSNGGTVSFTDISTGFPTSVSFAFGDGMVSSFTPGGTVTHTYASPGTYSVTLTAGNVYGSDTETKTVTVVVSTRTQATTAVISKVYPGGVVPAGKTVYTSLRPVRAGFLVRGWSSSYTPPFDGYLVLLDDTPKANWEHPVQWAQQADGQEPEITQHTSPPTNVELSRTAGDPPVIGNTNEIGDGFSEGYAAGGGGNAVCRNIDCRHCYALLISGGYDKANNFNRYWNDLSGMYKTLRETYCYPENHIYVLMSDGDDGADDRRTGETSFDSSPLNLDGRDDPDDIDGAATRTNVVNTIAMLNAMLTSEDDLFIFTTNHGGPGPVGTDKVRLWLWGEDEEQYIWDDDFVGLLAGSQARNITMTMEQCYSGGFVTRFIAGASAGQGRVIATAASATEPSYGNDFSYWWIDGAMGPANNLLRNPLAIDNGLISRRETFDYAAANDPSAMQDKEHPQYAATTEPGQPDLGVVTGLSSCSLCPDPLPLPNTAAAPVDADEDGLLEDLDGNGYTKEDARLFFQNFELMRDTQPVCRFDLSGNGRIDFADVVKLYQEAP